ncbi:mitosis inhibitor protein kinase [Echria macrotheca]|uniref:Mitosis inhibitor protein kinase n=1 Tax=Echria macrotheca TaxID=438768 RepID=A0AAJ0F6I2_9PEZI|nr:mitosis inhibitor protein kinase [Echria macrotheca]
MSFSNGSGGTLTLPSPTHVHHVDVASVRSLRRSLSRSPSKFGLRGASPSLTTPTAPVRLAESTTPPSPPPAASTTPPDTPSATLAFASSLTPQLSQITSTPLRSSVKLSLRSAKSKPTATRGSPRPRLGVSLRSPLKRVFGPSSDSGNSTPAPSADPAPQGQDTALNEAALALSPISRRNLEKPSRHSMHLDLSGSTKNGLSRLIGGNLDSFPSISVSPMKRSDAMAVDEDEPSLGSPVAKRRSLHGISGLGNFNFFDTPTIPYGTSAPPGFDIHEDANQEYQLIGSPASPFRDAAPPASTTPTSSIPKRTSSLRKSTLQQRHGESKTSWGRRHGEKQLAQLNNAASGSPRLGLRFDQYASPESSPFSPQVSLPNAPAHPAPRAPNQPHPLSRTLTQSSSNSSVPDDSPTHIPVPVGGQRSRVVSNFSKSLPLGSTRPVDGTKAIATPDYRRAKPHQGAFTSMGLVSKKVYRPDLAPPGGQGKMAVMPDTPCKKPYNSNTYPPQHSGGRRASRTSLGSPSTPFASLLSDTNRGNIFGIRDKPANLNFSQNRTGHNRKFSLLSMDGEDHGELVSSQDDIPPTPTKNFAQGTSTTPGLGFKTPINPRTSAFGMGGGDLVDSSPSCKSNTSVNTSVDSELVAAQLESERIDAIRGRASTPTPGVPHRVSSKLSTRARRRAQYPLKSKAVPKIARTSSFNEHTNGNANAVAAASPIPSDLATDAAPRTPQGSMAPPDASRLSISNPQDAQLPFHATPATPTAQASKTFAGLGDARLSVTPRNNHRPKDVDGCLVRMFEETEVIGQGKFSTVYRVAMSPPQSFTALFCPQFEGPHSPIQPLPKQFYAVKKLRAPITGDKSRNALLREVSILKTLSHSDKIVRYIASWESAGHLYIQTEFCPQGGLDGFLDQIGKRGKLDQFRAWKIMEEVLQGLHAIHSAGIVHLDIKPANILVTADRYLKIGDFGMAAVLPVTNDVEAEGDKLYIAPEVLSHEAEIGPAADIFSLGLSMLEACCNVFLPGDGAEWQALRNNNFSHIPFIANGEPSQRDANGTPLDTVFDDDGYYITAPSAPPVGITHNPSNLFGVEKRVEEIVPPYFMSNPLHDSSLDSVIRSMLNRNPAGRPSAEGLLSLYSIAWVNHRRTAGALVYEGEWGLQPVTRAREMDDTAMTDVWDQPTTLA